MKRKEYIVSSIMNSFFIFFSLFSYFIIKKEFGYVFENLIMLILFFVFLIYSIVIVIKIKEIKIVIFQLMVCLFLLLSKKFYLSDRIAMFFEIPKIEKKINHFYKTGELSDNMQVCDDYLIYDWEPGFLDYQFVLTFDKYDNLKYEKKQGKIISEGKLYIVYRGKENFYLCMLYR